jgi:hypothetical protein
MRRSAYAAALGLTALVAAWIASRPAPYALNGDAEMLLHPLLADAWRQVAAGQVPLWTTGRWGGSPLAADAVAGALYPPYYLAYALTAFPHWRGLDVSVVLHAGVLFLGLVWLLGRLGAPGLAGVLCGALLATSPTYVFVTRNWHQYWAALSYWPWLFGAAIGLAHAPSPRLGLLAAAALAGPVYAGYPEFALYAGIPALLWIPLAPGAARARRLGVAFVVGLGGILLALPQVVAGLLMASESIRFGPGGAERLHLLGRFFLLTPDDWRTVVDPTGARLAMPVKLAPSVVVLALVGACDRRPLVRWLVASALASAFLATGPNPIYDALHRLPPFSFFGAPLKFFYLTTFLVLLLAALGAARVVTLPLAVRRLTVLALAATLVVAAGNLSAPIIAATGAAACLALLPGRMLPGAAAALSVASAVVFLVASRALVLPSPFLPGAFMSLVRAPLAVTPAPGARALALVQDRTLRTLGLNYGALWGVDAWNGMGDLIPWRQAAVQQEAVVGAASRLARTLGADPVIVDARGTLVAELAAAGFRRTATAGGLAYFSAPAPLAARGTLAPRAKAVPAARAIAAARHGHVVEHGRLLVEAERLSGGAHGDAGGRVEVLEDASRRSRFRVAVARPTWLLVRQPYYPNWEARIDGVRTPLHPAGGFLMALLVDAGTHDVQVTYRECTLLPAALVALLTAGLLPRVLHRLLAPRRP